jgi:hypothetical protein
MPIQKEVWAADIKEKLFPEDSFVAQSADDTPFADNKTVHRAVAGNLPNVVRNRATVPAGIERRTDEDASYDLDEFTSDPTLIRDIEEVEVNYNKRQSVLRSHIATINLRVANWMQYHWAPTPSANLIRTTGAARTAIATAVGATGNRKKLLLADIFKLAALFDDMDLPENGRNLLLPAAMYTDLVEANWATLLQLQSEGSAILKDGSMMMLHGFKIYKRGAKNLLTYTNAGTPVKRTPEAGTLTSANAAALAWHSDFVTRAKGEVKVFENLDDATMYGSVFSALVRAGGRAQYPDFLGVAAIVEDAA